MKYPFILTKSWTHIYSIITVVIAPGPVNNGIAMGNTEISSLLVASFISSITERFAISLLSVVLIPAVNEMKVISPPTGFTITNIDANA